MKRIIHFAVGALLALSASAATAETLYVDDASRLKWAISVSNNAVYFRNFNEINSAWQGCCYVYYIDLSTDAGKSMFSTFLTRHAARQPLSFWVTDKSASVSQIGQLGDW